MEREEMVHAAIFVVIGIVAGLVIGWYLWHGAGSGTCPVPGI